MKIICAHLCEYTDYKWTQENYRCGVIIQKKNILHWYRTPYFNTIKHRILAKRSDIFANCKENGGGGEDGS